MTPFEQHADRIRKTLASAIWLSRQMNSDDGLTSHERTAATVCGILSYLACLTSQTKVPELTTRQAIEGAIKKFFDANESHYDQMARGRHN